MGDSASGRLALYVGWSYDDNYTGCPHGFDRVAPAASVARRSRADRLRVLKTP